MDKRAIIKRLGKTKCIAMAILFSCIALIFMASAASAQEEKKERGHNGRITITELLSKFKHGEIVKGYIIDGDDIIEIIRRTSYAIKLEDAIIEDGLNFQKLPEVPLYEIKLLPRGWNKRKWYKFRQGREYSGHKSIHTVKNTIQIANSEIQSEKKDVPSVNASETIFYNVVNFGRTLFIGRTDFSFAIFDGEAYFRLVTFSREVDFFDATFNGVAVFLDATFSGEANFRRAIISRSAYFTGATFHEQAVFEEFKTNYLSLDDTLFTKYADFRETTIGKLTCKGTSPAIIKGRIDFRNSSISEMHLQDIIFENDVDFSDVKFAIPLEKGEIDGKLATVFRYVTFESDANFIRTEFHSDTAFERIKFKGDANFTDIDFKDFKREDTKKFSLSYLTFKHLLLSMDDLPGIQHWVRDDKDRVRSFADVKYNKANKTGEENLQPLPNVLYSLEEVFHSQNNLHDANKAYYYRKLMELEDTRLMKHADTSKKITFLQRAWSEGEWYFWGVPCGYATSWIKIVSWCGGFYLFFVILYSVGGKLTKTYQEEEDEFRLRLFVSPNKFLLHKIAADSVSKKGWWKFFGALKLSMVIFFKIGYIDTKISGKILRIDAKYFVWAEWGIGYGFLIALVVTLSNTLPVVHRLISGIF